MRPGICFALAMGIVVVVLPRYKIVIDPFLIVLAANVFAPAADPLTTRFSS